MIVGAVLAAGLGRRMGAPKAGVLLAGRTLLVRAVEALRDGGCDAVLVVVPSGVEAEGAQVVVNPHPERGLRSSLALSIDAAGAADALLVTLVDQPGVTSEAVARAVGAWRPDRIVTTAWTDGSAHPVVMSPQRWADAIVLAGEDEGARRYLATHRADVWTVQGRGEAGDLDRPEDVIAWESRTR